MKANSDRLRADIVRYMHEHWQENISLEEISARYGSSERVFNNMFKTYFGLPYYRYMTKLGLHRAALAIKNEQQLTNMALRAGYANPQSFSKAFKKEFGISPREFLKSGKEVPDMPVVFSINGEALQLSYVTTDKKIVYGSVYRDDTNTDRMKDSIKIHGEINWESSQTAIIWWRDNNGSLCRMEGKFTQAGGAFPENEMTSIVLPADCYAVFKVKCPHEERIRKNGVSLMINRLLQYIYQEWMVINEIRIRSMGYTYACLQGEEIKVYIPIFKRTENLKVEKYKGAQDWIRYIDDHIHENLTVSMLADAFNYSERHYTDTFEMYFGVRPGKYIQKRKLYCVVAAMKQEKKRIDELVKSYGFSSYAAFTKMFQEEFFCCPEDYKVEYKLDNMNQYYSFYKKEMKITDTYISGRIVAGRNVSEEHKKREHVGDLIESIAWFLQYNEAFYEGKEAQIVVWKTAREKGKHYCLVGQMLNEEKEYESFDSTIYEKITIDGGKYAVAQTLDLSDRENLTDTYRRMYRLAFGGWLRENQEKVDLNRLTFVQYQNGKLYFYIPIYG